MAKAEPPMAPRRQIKRSRAVHAARGCSKQSSSPLVRVPQALLDAQRTAAALCEHAEIIIPHTWKSAMRAGASRGRQHS